MQYADHLVDAAAINRNAGVTKAGQLVENRVVVGREVDANDFIARDHDVFDRALFQVQHGEQHLLVLAWDDGAGFHDDCPQFLAAERHLIGLVRADAE